MEPRIWWWQVCEPVFWIWSTSSYLVCLKVCFNILLPLYLRIPSGVIPSIYQLKFCMFSITPVLGIFLPIILIDHSLNTWWRVRIIKRLVMQFSLFLSIPYVPLFSASYFHTFCSFFIQCGTAFHTYKIKDTHGNIKVSKMNGGKHLWKLICCYFLCECKFDFLLLFPSIWTSSLFKGSIKYLYVTIFSCIFMTGHEHTSTHLFAYSFSAFRPAFLHHMPAMSWVLQAKLQMWEI